MNPLLKRLAALRWKVRLIDSWLGVCALVSLVLGIGVTVGVLDAALHLPNLVRAVLLIVTLVSSGYVAWRYFVKPMAQPVDDLNLALRVEDAYPELNDSLATTVQFLNQSPEDQARQGGSDVMRQKTIKDAIDKASGFDFNRILDRKAALIFGTIALVVLLAGGGVIGAANYYRPGYAGIALMRFVEPFGSHTWTRITVARNYPHEEEKWKELDPRKPDSIAVGNPYFIRIDLDGQMPKSKQVRMEIQNLKTQIKAEKLLEVKIDPVTRTASVNTAIDMTQHYTEFQFRLKANDGMFPPRGGWQTVNVKLPPKLENLDGQMSPHISISPPQYTDLPPRKELPGSRHLEVYAGTEVLLRAKADRPLEQAWLEFHPENKMTTEASIMSLLSVQSPFQIAATAVASDAMFNVIPAQLEKDPSVFRIRFSPTGVGKYILHMRDADHLHGYSEVDVNVLRDPLPDVKLVRPSSSVQAYPDAKVAFKFRVKDEIFAVRNVFVEYRYRGPDGNPLPEVHRIMLYEAKDYGTLLPSLLQKMGRSPLVSPLGRLRPEDLRFGAGQSLRLRPKDLDFETVWSLNGQFKVGDNLILEVCAEDFCDTFPFRDAGRSSPIELRIISKQDLVRDAQQKLGEIKKHLTKAEENQKKARDIVNDIKKLEKPTQEDKDRLVEAEQMQREVQEQIGKAADQGIRREINELRQQLRDNELQNTEVFDQTGKIKGVTDRIANNELPQIEPKLADARNELTQKDKNSPQTKEKLEEVAKNQKSVLDAIAELNKTLDPSMRVAENRQKLEDIRDKQAKQNENLQNLKDDKAQQDQNPNLDKKEVEKRFKEDVAKAAKEQQELAQDLEKVIQEMKASRDQMIKDGDRKNAEKLDKAIDQAEAKPQQNKKNDPMPMQDQKPISSEMKDIANEMKNKSEPPQKAIDQQKELLKKLEDTIAKLDDPKRDNLAQDIKDRKDVEKDIKDIRKDIKDIKDQNKEINKIEDKEERLKKREELAKQQEALQQKLEKMERQLAQLQEQKAADEVKGANDDLAKAAKQAQQGDDPQKALDDADKKLRDAQEGLREAEEQLAREMLIRMHDRLKAVKERQDSMVERSEGLHEKILKRKSWTSPFLDTMEGNIDAQKMIGEESEAVRDKIKEAKVFNGILERAKESMDKAATTMEGRRELGKERRYIEMGEGKLFDMDEVKDENEAQTDTIRYQKQAAKRLESLLDALKQEIAKKPPVKKNNPEQQAKNEDDPKEKEPKKNPIQGGGDGIPPTAEIKALRSEQLDLNERTEEFDRKNPDRKDLTDAQQRELNELHLEQERLQALFGGLVAPPMPAEPKEGEPKK